MHRWLLVCACAICVGGCGPSAPPYSCRQAAARDAGVTSRLATEAGDAGPAGSDAAVADAAIADAGPRTYDQIVLADSPAAYWTMQHAGATEADLTGSGHTGTYSGSPGVAILPDGEAAADFAADAFLAVPSSPRFSITTAGTLTWEGWIKPDSLGFSNDNGYVNWMGKCASYTSGCEWEARFYDSTNGQARCNRFSAYAFNPTGSLGAGADWQPVCGLLRECDWHHVVGEYTLLAQPANCPSTAQYPGAINIWVDGVPWNQPVHAPTGCMSEFQIVPMANGSPVNIGASAMDSEFDGGIGKVAIYGYLLTQAQITAHFQAMTGHAPSGSCAVDCTE